MVRIYVKMEVAIPVDADDSQIKEWLEMNLCHVNSVATSNPLHRFDVEGDSSTLQWKYI